MTNGWFETGVICAVLYVMFRIGKSIGDRNESGILFVGVFGIPVAMIILTAFKGELIPMLRILF